MPSFFAESDWFHCLGATKCVNPGSTTRLLEIEDVDEVTMPGFLTIRLTGPGSTVTTGFGFSVEDASDPRNNKIYFFEVLGGGRSKHYTGQVTNPDPKDTIVHGKCTEFSLTGRLVTADDWTANRPTN